MSRLVAVTAGLYVLNVGLGTVAVLLAALA